MRGKTHCTIGILSSIQAALIFKLPITFFSILISAIFSILPDLDEPNSTISNLFFKRNTSKDIYKLIIYIINIMIFFVSLKINDNFFISSSVTFLAIFIVESKLTHKLLRKVLLSLTFILLSVCLYFVNFNIYLIAFPVLLAIFPWIKHRGFSHCILSIIIIFFLLKQIELITNISDLAFFGTIGYASHIFLGDIFTKQGVPIFYPLIDKKISLASFRVGSSLGNVFELLFVIALMISIVYSIVNGGISM